MSDLKGWMSGIFALDPSTGSLTLPLWAAGALTALFVVICVLALTRAMRDGMSGVVGRAALVFAGVALAWLYIQGIILQNGAAERRALEARADVLATRATMPGSPLACLDAMAGDAVDGACERTLFASPEAMASAVSHAAAQLGLFVDVSDFVNRGHSGLQPLLATLRRAVESDRYGLVAHVLATRDGCTSVQCPALARMRDAGRVSSNLAQRTYDLYVTRHSAAWPATASGPVASAPATTPAVAGAALPPGESALASPGSPRPPGTGGPELFFPTSETIPPVNIMTAEPARSPETTGSAPVRTPPRRPAQKDQQPKQESKQAPIDLNAAARGAPPAQ
jgi:hypothetical protein